MSRAADKQFGGGRLQLLIILLITVALIVLAVRLVPVYVKKFEFDEAVREEAKFAAVREAPPPEVRLRLLRKAQELGLPIQAQQIRVTPSGQGIRISVSYTVPVQLPGYTLNLNFQISADTASAY